jgi:superfamily II RNA helicase
MGSNELMITEMVLQCILADKQPSEIAALLSCLVFCQKTREEPKLTGITNALKKVIHTPIFTQMEESSFLISKLKNEKSP